MAEAEELIIDGVRHASMALSRLWKRHRPPPPEPPAIHLADVKRRLELLIGAVLGRSLPVREAQASAPVPLVHRFFARDRVMYAPRCPLPGNDGIAVYLPPRLFVADVPGRAAGTDDYCFLALLQALRCERGSASLLRSAEGALAMDLYLLAEGVATDHALRRLMPGWCASLTAFNARAARDLKKRWPRGRQEIEVAALYEAFLLGSGPAPPPVRTPATALDWATSSAHAIAKRHPHERYTAWLGDLVIGCQMAPEGIPSSRIPTCATSQPPEQPGKQAVTALSRRPRVRNAENEDDPSPGVWMIQTSEPTPHAEDPLGLNRPEDREADDDPQGCADSLAEMAEARLIHTPSRSRENFCSSDPPPRLAGSDPAAEGDGGIVYPEWDFQSGTYREEAVRVCLGTAREGASDWAGRILERHAGILRDIRRRLGAIRPDCQILKGRTEGEEIDWDALVADRCERRAGLASAGAFYQSRWPAPRRVGLVLLIDASASTDAWVSGDVRVIDVEKEAALVAASALSAARMDFAVLAFSGEGPRGVQLRVIKAYDDVWSLAAERRIAGLEPDRYTRLGAALRHAARILVGQPVAHRLLLLFSDGRPNDCDCYASRYGIEDARQALMESRLGRISPYCFTVDREGSDYLPTIFGPGHYTIVQRPQQLPMAFIEWLRLAARTSGTP